MPVSTAIGIVGLGYDTVGEPTINYVGQVFSGTIESQARVARLAKLGGYGITGAGAVATYIEDRQDGHSALSSTVGAGTSTLIPAFAGAGTGFLLGLGAGGFDALPGALVGGGVGIIFGNKINESGMSSVEYFESGRSSQDVLGIKDDNGETLGEYLNLTFGQRQWIARHERK